MSQHPGFDDDPRIDELLRIGSMQHRIKTQVFGHALQVNLSHREADPGLRFNDSDEFQRLGGFTHTQSTDAEGLSQRALRRQTIAVGARREPFAMSSDS